MIIDGSLLCESASSKLLLRDRQQPASTPTRVACITATGLNSELLLKQNTVNGNEGNP
jgi:hypothetical protein